MGETLRWGLELASALGHAHASGILHRDVKPANVLIADGGHALLSDFGLARPLTSDRREAAPLADPTITATGAVVGTPAYMSPEQVLGQPIDERSDVFSLGAVLCEMCTGRPLVTAGSSQDVARALAALEPPPIRRLNAGVSRELERIVRRAVAPRPERRYPDARALAADLGRHRERWQFESQLPARRRRRAIFTACVVVLLAATIVAALRIGAGRRERRTNIEAVTTALVTWPSREWEGRISPDRRWLSFLSSRDGATRLWLRSLEGDLELALTPVESAVQSHAWSDDSREIIHLAQRDGRDFLQVVPALGGPPRRSLPVEPALTDARLLRWDGSRVYLEARGSLVLLELDGGHVREIVPAARDSALSFHFDVRADDGRLVYSAGGGESIALWTSDPDGRNAVRLTSGEFSDTRPVWIGRAGDSVAYTSNRSGQLDLWRLRVDDRSVAPVTLGPGAEYASSSAADGSLLVFDRTVEETHLWRLDLGSGAIRQLTDDSLSDAHPTTAPRARVVAFQRVKPRLDPTSRGAQILIARLAADRLLDTRVAAADGYEARLSPDGRWLAYRRGLGLWVQDVATADARRATERFRQTGRSDFPLAWVESNLAWLPDRDSAVFVESSSAGDRVLALSLGAAHDATVVVPAVDGTRIANLYASDDGRRLAYTARRRPGSVDLRCRDLSSGEDRVLFTARQLQPRGWLDAGALLVILARPNPDLTETLELVSVGLAGERRALGTIPRGLAATTTLDPVTRTLYVTAAADDDAHNVVAFALDDGKPRWLTDNRSPAVTFPAVQVLPDGALLLTRQEWNNDIWATEFRHDR